MANTQSEKITVTDGTRTLELETSATESSITSSISRIALQRNSGGGKTQLVSKSNGAFDAELSVERGDDANANLVISQKATNTQIIPGSSTGTIFVNPANADTDFIVRGDTDDDLLRVDAGNNSVGIGVPSIDASAKLQVDSTTQGFLPPRMSKAQVDAIASPATGLFVFNTDDECLQWYNGSHWICLAGSSSGLVKKSWGFTTPAGSSGVFYIGGFYDMFFGNNDFSPSINFGIVNNPYASHFFVVVGSVPVDTVTIRVTGTSINDNGVRVTGDTDDIVLTTGNLVDDYAETPKKWLGQVSISIVSGTPVQCNYGYSKYWDNANNDFTIRGWEATWTGGANDTAADLSVIHHRASGWTYNAGAEPTPPPPVASMSVDHGVESDVANNESGSWKRVNINEAVSGSTSEGFLLRVTTGASKAFEMGNFILSIS